jgi:hypothetical protein
MTAKQKASVWQSLCDFGWIYDKLLDEVINYQGIILAKSGDGLGRDKGPKTS